MINIKGTSKELQEISLIGFMNDPYLLGKCMEKVTESFFENPIFRVIYRCLKSYYSKYTVLPTEKELAVIVSNECSNEEGIDSDEAIDTLSKLFNSEVASEDFIYEQVIEFVRRNNIEKTLNSVVDYMNSGEIDLDRVAAELSDDLHISLSGRQSVYNLSDIESIKTVREEALGSLDSPMLIKFFIEAVNRKMQYKALPPGTLNMVSAAPGCGKTTLMINQGLYTAKQGFKVLHIFLGDMSKYDGLLRYLSNLTGINTDKLVDLNTEELKQFVTKNNMTGVLSNVFIASYAQGEVTASQLIEDITAMQKQLRVHFNLIIVDYDENISKDDDNIYESGGLIYNKLGLFAVCNKSVAFIVSQPKQQYWNQEIIPLEAAAESSKKQKIIDTMITMGKPFRGSSVGSVYIAKNRRGEVGSIMRVKINGANTRIEHIAERDYNIIKAREQSAAEGETNDDV